MALYDWNNDGKNDYADDFIEYQIYSNSRNKSSSDSSDTSGWWMVLIVIIITAICPPLGLLILLGITLLG